MKIFYFILLVLVISTISCVSGYKPVPQPHIEIQDDFAILLYDSTVLIASSVLWTIDPQNLPDHFTTLRVRLHNRSPNIININQNDFVIIDENSLQYDALSTDFVLDMLMLNEVNTTTRGLNQDINPEPRRDSLHRRILSRQNVLIGGFNWGEIHPGAAKEGIIFFPKLPNQNKEFKLIFKSKEILFRR